MNSFSCLRLNPPSDQNSVSSSLIQWSKNFNRHPSISPGHTIQYNRPTFQLSESNSPAWQWLRVTSESVTIPATWMTSGFNRSEGPMHPSLSIPYNTFPCTVTSTTISTGWQPLFNVQSIILWYWVSFNSSPLNLISHNMIHHLLPAYKSSYSSMGPLISCLVQWFWRTATHPSKASLLCRRKTYQSTNSTAIQLCATLELTKCNYFQYNFYQFNTNRLLFREKNTDNLKSIKIFCLCGQNKFYPASLWHQSIKAMQLFPERARFKWRQPQCL